MRPTSAGQYRPFQLEGLTKKVSVWPLRQPHQAQRSHPSLTHSCPHALLVWLVGRPQAEVQFTDHTWLPDGRMALVLSDRRLVLVDGVQVTQTVALSGTPSCVTALPDGHVLVALQKVREVCTPGVPRGRTLARAERAPLHLRPHDGHQGAMDLLKPESANPGSGLARAVTVKAPTADDAGATGIDLTARALSPVPGGSKVAVYIRGGPVLMLNVRLAKVRRVPQRGSWQGMQSGTGAQSSPLGSLACTACVGGAPRPRRA